MNTIEHDGIGDAVDLFLKEGIALSVQVVAHQRRKAALAAQQQGENRWATEQRASVTAARDELKAAKDAIAVARVHQSEWWENATAGDVVRTYRTSVSAADSNPAAREAVKRMQAELQSRYGFDPATLDSTEISDADAQTALEQRLKTQEADRELRQPRRESVTADVTGEAVHELGEHVAEHGIDQAVGTVALPHEQLVSLALSQAVTASSHSGGIEDDIAAAQNPKGGAGGRSAATVQQKTLTRKL